MKSFTEWLNESLAASDMPGNYMANPPGPAPMPGELQEFDGSQTSTQTSTQEVPGEPPQGASDIVTGMFAQRVDQLFVEMANHNLSRTKAGELLGIIMDKFQENYDLTPGQIKQNIAKPNAPPSNFPTQDAPTSNV